MADILNVEVLPDGTLKITTDVVSMQNHMAAEAFLRESSRLMGGTSKRVRRVNIGSSLKHALDAHAADGHTHDDHHVHA